MPLRLFSACRHGNKNMEYKESLPLESEEIKNRIIHYWTGRSHEFCSLREREQESAAGLAWLTEIKMHLPDRKPLKLLDTGCGTGMFSLMLSLEGHDCTGIDLTEHMILHARQYL